MFFEADAVFIALLIYNKISRDVLKKKNTLNIFVT